MAPTSACPDDTALRRLALGQLAEGEAGPLEEHLAGCDRCAATLQALQARDTLVRGLQEAHAAPLPEGALIDGLVHRLQVLQPSPNDPARDAAAASPGGMPPRLGEYRLLREVGRGGMGVVYEAVQESLGRHVALKVLPSHALLSAEHGERFRREARAAALLHHSNIVPVFGVGQDQGVHFYAMQFIHGQSLARVIADRRRNAGLDPVDPTASTGSGADVTDELPAGPGTPPRTAAGTRAGGDVAPPTAPGGARGLPGASDLRTAAQLGVQAAEALEHAHQLGVVHRDVKPANLLVDGRGHLWVTDFGLAQVQSDTRLTLTGDLVGTLRYMSPEQALGRRLAIDHRTDVYSLGATLYELLTLEPAFAGADRQELLRQIASEEPRPPRRLNRAVPADLETVVLKALAKDPAERYATAQELADDLGRFLEDRPTRARPPTPAQRLVKWARRHKPVVASAAASMLGLLVTAVIALAWGNVRITHEWEQKVAALRDKDAALQEAQRQKKLAFRRFYAAQMNLAHQAWEAGQPARALDLLEGQRPGDGEDDLRAFEWYYLWRLCHRGYRLSLKVPTAQVCGLAFSPDGKALAAGGADAEVKLWDPATGRERATWKGQGGILRTLTFSPDGKTLVAAVHTAGSPSLRLYDAATGRERALPGQPQKNVWSLAFAPDGRLLASGEDDGTVRLWDTTSWRERATLAGHAAPVVCVAFSPDGKALATGSAWGTRRGGAKVWDVTAVPPRLRFELPAAYSVAFSPDGTLLAVSGGDGEPRGDLGLFEVATGRQRAALPGHVGTVFAVAFAPDGSTLASAGNDRTIRLWDVAAGRQRACSAALGPVYALGFSPDGTLLASGGARGTIHLWDAAPAPDDLVLAGAGACVAFAPDGRTLASSGQQATKLWDVATWEARSIPSPPGVPPTDWLAFAPDGQTLAVARGPAVRLLDAAARRERGTLAGPNTFWNVALSPDGRTLATAIKNDLAAHLWDLPTRRVRADVTSHPTGFARAVAFSPDGTLLATGSQFGVVKLWEAATGRERATLQGPEPTGMNWVFAVAFSADGTLLAGADRQGLVKVWEVDTGALRATLRGHTDSVFAVAFSPDATTLATGGDDRTVKLWDVATGQERMTLKGHPDAIPSVAFSPDGTLLVTGSWDDTVRVWRTATDAEARARRPAGSGE